MFMFIKMFDTQFENAITFALLERYKQEKTKKLGVVSEICF